MPATPDTPPAAPTTGDLLHDAATRAARYLDGLGGRGTAPDPAALAGLRVFEESLPAGPSDPRAVLDLLDRFGSPATTAQAGPRFFGWVIGGSVPAALAATWLAAAWGQNVGRRDSSPVGAELEDVSLRWLIDLLRLPADCGGGFVTGATMANFSCLAAARHAVLRKAGWDVEAQGLFGAPPVTVVVGAEAHVTLFKALGLLGFGRARVVTVPADGQGRMRADAFPALSGPTIVCLQAGNVNTGASDPFVELCPAAQAAGAWVHVDGAFGLWAAATDGRRQLVAGVDAADSWATDAHKWLNVPYDSGVALVRDGAALRAAMSVSATYLPESGGREPSDFTPELSRRARGVEIWAALRSLGRAGIADLVERNCRLASRFADGLRRAGFEILNEVVLNQVLVSFGTEAETRRVIDGLLTDGTCWCGGTVWQGRFAMRISVSSWRTTEVDVDTSLAAMLRIAAAVQRGQPGPLSPA